MRKAMVSDLTIDLWVYAITVLVMVLFFIIFRIAASPQQATIEAVQGASMDEKRLQAFLELPYEDSNYENTKVWQALASQVDSQIHIMQLDAKKLHPMVCSIIGSASCWWKIIVLGQNGQLSVQDDLHTLSDEIAILSVRETPTTNSFKVDASLDNYVKIRKIALGKMTALDKKIINTESFDQSILLPGRQSTVPVRIIVFANLEGI